MSKQILIIGAGIAGLTAYRELTRLGHDALILEARSVCGGRISTDFSLNIPIGRGATWIHGIDGNPITELAISNHIKIVPSNLNQFLRFDRHHQPIPNSIVSQFDLRFSELLKEAKSIAFHMNDDASLFSVLRELVRNAHFSSVEEDIFQTKLRFFEGYIGAEDSKLSARYWDFEESWPGENGFLAGSYQPIIDDLSKDIKINLNTIVKKICWYQQGVTVMTNQGEFKANAAIVTLPLGVLKSNSVVFEPDLPEEKRNSINRLGMGLLNVSAFQFSRTFWPEDVHAMSFGFDDASIVSFVNLHHFSGQPILLGYYGGSRAQVMESMSDRDLLEKVFENFKRVFGNDIPDIQSHFFTRWNSDPFACGSYSYYSVGATPNDFDELAKPVQNRLFFSGEATSSRFLATTHGAYLSGIRAAQEIDEAPST